MVIKGTLAVSWRDQSISQELKVVTPHGESALLEPCVFLVRKVNENLDRSGE
jgi:hypothetical protein